MVRTRRRAKRIPVALAASALAAALSLPPATPAFAASDDAAGASSSRSTDAAASSQGSNGEGSSPLAGSFAQAVERALQGDAGTASFIERIERTVDEAQRTIAERTNRVLAYDRALIAAIGNQGSTGHWICCPGFACAYGDAIIHGVANPHEAYGCGCCTWPGWGGGNSSFRSLGSDAALLREAYDQIASGKPTVVHVAGASGEHWICLIGYRDAQDPDNLSLGNFIALDPTDGAEIVASDRYTLYGDACEHISEA